MRRRPPALGQAGWLVVGLGNPGAEYAGTRHNVGFDVCERIVAAPPARWRRHPAGAVEALAQIDGCVAVVVKPRTFVNRSGAVVRGVSSSYGLDLTRLIVVHDDIDLEFGKLRVRRGGSSGGHRGVRSITDALGGDAFLRVKIGVGRPPAGMDAADHVLGSFTAAERPVIEMAVEHAAAAVRGLVLRDINEVMQEFNRVNASQRTSPNA